jgi:small-conductance mechanosensitive channel
MNYITDAMRLTSDVYSIFVQYFMLAVSISFIPSCIMFSLAKYLIPASAPSQIQHTETNKTEQSAGQYIHREIHLNIVVGAVLGALACLTFFGILLLAQKMRLKDTLIGLDKNGEAYFLILDRTVIVVFVGWLLIGFHFVVKSIVKNLIVRTLIQLYVMTFLFIEFVPGDILTIFTGNGNSILKLLSFGYGNLSGILSEGLRIPVDVDKTTFWPEKLLQFFFYFSVVFCALKYFVEVLFNWHIKKSGGNDGAFDIEAIMVAVNAFIWIITLLFSFGMLEVNLGGLGLTTGLIGAGLTISFRDLLNNFFSGILLNLDNSIRVNDVIRTSDGVIGEVKKISLRYTFLETRDNVDILIPNSLLIQNRFENLTRTQQEVRLSLRFSVDQGVDIERVRNIVLKACMFVPEVSGVTGRTPAVFYLGVSESSNQFDLRFWVTTPRPGPAKLQSDVAYAVFKQFQKEKIALPSIRQITVEKAPDA